MAKKSKDFESDLNQLKLAQEHSNNLIVEVNGRINGFIAASNASFNNMAIAIQNLNTKKEADDKLMVRQFCIQSAALCCQRNGGDVIQLANQIHDYVLDNPKQVVPENLVRLKSNN